MDANTGEVTKSVKLDKLIDSLSHSLKYPNELFITNDYIYIGFDQGVVAINNSYELKLKINVRGNFKHFAVNGDGKVLLFNEAGPVSLFSRKYALNENDEETKIFDLDLGGSTFSKSDNGIYYTSFDSLFTIHVVRDSIYKNYETTATGLKNFRAFYDNYPGFISKDYIYFFPYVKRDKLIITDKKLTKIIKTIAFRGFNWSVSKDDQNNEAGHPEFFVDIQGDEFFITADADGPLSVYKGCLGLKN